MAKTYRITTNSPTQYLLNQAGDYIFELLDPDLKIEIFASLEATGQEELTLNVLVHHQAPHTTANTTLKATATDQAQVNLNGKIKIEPNCPDSHSFLTERILLLSPQAQAQAIPDLEILTDDVTCSHAASISQIPEEELFYLQSRGIPLPTAQKLIIEGFLQPPFTLLAAQTSPKPAQN